MRTVQFAQARKHLERVLDQVVNDVDITVITRRAAPDVVVMPLEMFSRWQETVHLNKTPANARHLAKSVRQFRAGRVQRRTLRDAG